MNRKWIPSEIAVAIALILAFFTNPDQAGRAADPHETMSIKTLLDAAPYKLLEISVPLDCTDDTWTPTSLTNVPDGRRLHTAVWTGSEMIVWGGYNGSWFSTGGRYNPGTDNWTATSTGNTPAARLAHTAVWTGTEMIVWGGDNGTFLRTGGRYNPSSDGWTTTSTTGAPAGRSFHTAVWAGSEMIVWGGFGCGGANCNLNTGGRYNPNTNSWTATSITNAPSARYEHSALWTGREMIIWGGYNGTDLNTGGRYNPNTNSWTATSVTNAPTARFSHTAVWTGSEMVVWGGYGDSTGDVNTGGRYNPSADSWTATSTGNAPAARIEHSAVWTGGEIIVWGGYNQGYLNTGGSYNPGTDSWTAASTGNAPAARIDHTAVSTGTEMIVWGGYNGSYFNTGGRYCAQPIIQAAASRKMHGAAGRFDVDLPLSGAPGIECRTNSATNDHVVEATFSGNVTVNGNPQAAVTSGIGIVGSAGMSNGGMVLVSGNIVTVSLTNVANAQTINVTLFGVNGTSNLIIPMSTLVGDVSGNAAVNVSDIALTKSRTGQPLNQTNFRADVSAGGSINASDVSLVKSHIGTALP